MLDGPHRAGLDKRGTTTDLPILSVCAHFWPKHREIKAKIKTSYLHLLFEGFAEIINFTRAGK